MRIHRITAAASILASLFLHSPDALSRPPAQGSGELKVTGLEDPIMALNEALIAGEVTIDQDDEKAFLTGVLEQLKVPVTSQVLVFSKTSLQNSRISPERPRALYFSDDLYIGWVQGGMIEVVSHDVRAGALFYVIEREPSRGRPRIVGSEDCLSCHEGSRTRGVPGVMVRSLYTADTGRPILAAGSFLTDHTSPMEERWGGWYVTGQHGSVRHMGNVLASWVEEERRAEIDREAGANLPDLNGVINTEPYLRDTSDIVALMVLEHQVGMLNRISEAQQYFRNSMRTAKAIYPGLEEATSEDGLQGSALSVARSYARRVVEYMLFAEEAELPEGGIDGSVDFQEAFGAEAPRSKSGHSLKDFHLLSRLFKNRCSYMIYSNAFKSLHPALKDTVYRELWAVLDGREDEDGTFAHLGLAERRRIIAVIRETIDGLPDCWSEEPDEK